jgi:hypothetical protein
MALLGRAKRAELERDKPFDRLRDRRERKLRECKTVRAV